MEVFWFDSFTIDIIEASVWCRSVQTFRKILYFGEDIAVLVRALSTSNARRYDSLDPRLNTIDTLFSLNLANQIIQLKYWFLSYFRPSSLLKWSLWRRMGFYRFFTAETTVFWPVMSICPSWMEWNNVFSLFLNLYLLQAQFSSTNENGKRKGKRRQLPKTSLGWMKHNTSLLRIDVWFQWTTHSHCVHTSNHRRNILFLVHLMDDSFSEGQFEKLTIYTLYFLCVFLFFLSLF